MSPTPWGYWSVSRDKVNSSGVYILVYANKYLYIGSSNRCSHRINQHISDIRRERHTNSFLVQVHSKHKDLLQTFFIYTNGREEAYRKEQELLDFFYQDPHCMNLSSDAIRVSHSQSGIETLSRLAKQQHIVGNFGYEKVVEWNKSERSRKMKSESAKKQRENPEYVKWLYEQVSLAQAKEYNIWLVNSKKELVLLEKNLAQFCLSNGLDKGNLRKVLNGKNKSHKGWRLL